jgi:hypothetical protein
MTVSEVPHGVSLPRSELIDDRRERLSFDEEASFAKRRKRIRQRDNVYGVGDAADKGGTDLRRSATESQK